MSVSEQPTSFTELYFSRPTVIDPGVVIGRRPQSIAYTVVNHTGAYRNYEVTVSLLVDNVTHYLTQSGLGLAVGAAAQRAVVIRPGHPGTTAELEVSIGAGQEIHLRLRFA